MELDLKKLANVPTVPAIVFRLLEAISDTEATIQKIADIIKSDPAISSGIVKAANSAMYTGMQRLDSLDRCVLRLGKVAVACLALSFSMKDKVAKKGQVGDMFQTAWLYSVIQATAMENLSRQLRVGEAGQAFLGGLLMDIGRLSLIEHYSDEYLKLVHSVESQDTWLPEAERNHFGMDHAEIAENLMRTWGLPESLVRLARYQHSGVDVLKQLEADPDYKLIALANVASATCDFLVANRAIESFQRCEAILRGQFQLDKHAFVSFISATRDKLQNLKDFYAIDVERMPCETRLLAMAVEQMANLAMRQSLTQETTPEDALRLKQENEEIRARLDQLETRNCMDSLTKVYNRDYFDGRFTERLKQNQGQRPLAILFVDIDNFKTLNDTYGHLLGDDVLQQVGNSIRNSLRNSDVVARFGGEEFVVLLECPIKSLFWQIAERIRRSIEKLEFELGENKIKVTISLGGVYTLPDSGELDIPKLKRQLVQIADEAMYQSKKAGKNRCTLKEFSCTGDSNLVSVLNFDSEPSGDYAAELDSLLNRIPEMPMT